METPTQAEELELATAIEDISACARKDLASLRIRSPSKTAGKRKVGKRVANEEKLG